MPDPAKELPVTLTQFQAISEELGKRLGRIPTLDEVVTHIITIENMGVNK